MMLPRINEWPEEIPSTLNCKISKYEFILVDKLLVEGDEAWGATDWDKETIEILRGISEAAFKDTVLHETLHVILEFMGLPHTIEVDGLLPAISNEQLVLKLTKGILLFSALNKKLFEYLFS